MARHQQLHEIAGVTIAVLALDHDLIDILVIDIADRALDQIAIMVDQRWRGRSQRRFADVVPNAGKIIEIALDLGLGALQSGRADDAAHR